MDPFLGEIRLFPFGRAPKGWMACEGQILSFNTNIALASLLGNRFGGDGRTTFALPDLRGRVALGQNLVATFNPTIGVHTVGSQGGSETVALDASNLPLHSHGTHVSTAPGTVGPEGAIPAVSSTTAGQISKPTYVTADTASQVVLNKATVAPTPGAPLPNMQPSIVGYYCIAITGIYPSRP